MWAQLRARAECVQQRVDATFRPHEFSYKKNTAPADRRLSCEHARSLYPDRVPVVLERASADCPVLERSKFLVPVDMTVAQFLHIVRVRLRMGSEHALLLFVNDIVPTGSERMGVLYSKNHDAEDGFLYMRYDKEHAFG